MGNEEVRKEGTFDALSLVGYEIGLDVDVFG